MSRARVLVVDDKESVLEVMVSILGAAHDVTATSDPVAAGSLLAEIPFDVVLSDVRMPAATGFDLLDLARRSRAAPSVVLMTGYASIPDAVQAMRRGAFDYVAKPLEPEEVALVVARAVDERRRRAEGCIVDDPDRTPPEFHAAMAEARERATREYLVSLLRRFQGQVTRAAEHAGITRESLHRLMRRYGVHSVAFRPQPVNGGQTHAPGGDAHAPGC